MHVEFARLNDTVQMDIDEIETRALCPSVREARLDVLGLQWLPQQRIVHQVDLADRKIVCSSPIAVEQTELFFAQPTFSLIIAKIFAG